MTMQFDDIADPTPENLRRHHQDGDIDHAQAVAYLTSTSGPGHSTVRAYAWLAAEPAADCDRCQSKTGETR